MLVVSIANPLRDTTPDELSLFSTTLANYAVNDSVRHTTGGVRSNICVSS